MFLHSVGLFLGVDVELDPFVQGDDGVRVEHGRVGDVGTTLEVEQPTDLVQGGQHRRVVTVLLHVVLQLRNLVLPRLPCK